MASCEYSQSPYGGGVGHSGRWSWEPAILLSLNVNCVVKRFDVSELIITVMDTLEKSDNHQFIVSLNDYVKAAPNYEFLG